MNKCLAIAAYRATVLATGDAKSIEAAVFTQANLTLARAMRQRHSDWPGFVAALSKNLQLWTAVAADVLSEGNGLPDELRAQIYALSKFVRARSLDILRNEPDADASALIEINANIAAGLHGGDRAD